jgi:hypothetical protein
MATPCATPACIGGHCTGTYAPQGAAPPAQQVMGDCKTILCDGHGGMTELPDFMDPPPNADACHMGFCIGEMPTQQMQPNGTSCAPCSTCQAGVCTSTCGAGCTCLPGGTCSC